MQRDAARNEQPRSKDLEEEVNRRQYTRVQMEERSGLLETMERKQKLRIGAPKEREHAFFRDILVLEDVTSEMEKELREAGEAL